MPVLGGRPEVAGVDGEVDVGLGVLALGGDALAQLGVVAGEELDLDAGLLRPRLERRLDAVVAPGVHGERLAVVAAAAGDERRRGERPEGADRPVVGPSDHQAATLEDVRAADHSATPYWRQMVGKLYIASVPTRWPPSGSPTCLLGAGAPEAPALVAGDDVVYLRPARRRPSTTRRPSSTSRHARWSCSRPRTPSSS